MKRYLGCTFLLIFILFVYPVNAQSTIQNESPKPPAILVYYNSWPGDHENPLFKNNKMSPKIPMNIYTFKDLNSEIITTVQPGSLITLITADYHTFPSASPVLVLKEICGLKPGDIIYLMNYIGGGDCLVWYNNDVLCVPAEGIEGVKLYKEQRLDVPMWAKLQGQLPATPILWLYVKTEDNKYGWIKYNTYREWQRLGCSIFTH